MVSLKRWRLLLALAGLLAVGFAAPASASDSEVKALAYLRDDTGAMTLHDAQRAPGWVANPGDGVDLGFSDAAFWLRLETINRQPAEDPLYLRIDNALIHDVRYYGTAADGAPLELHSGFLVANPYRNAFHDPKFVFPVGAPFGTAQTIYVRVASKLPLTLRVALHSQSEMHRLARREDFIFGAIFGILFLMPLYNFLVYLCSRDRGFLLFALSAFLLALTFFTVEGYVSLLLPNFSLFWKERALHLAGASSFVTLVALTRELLKTRVHAPALDLALRAEAAVAGLIGVLVLTGDRPIYSLVAQIVTASIVITCLLAGATCRKRSRLAYCFIFGSAAYLLGSLLFMAQLNHFIPKTLLTAHGLHFGAIFQEMFLSFAVAFKISALNSEVHLRSVQLEQINGLLSAEVAHRKQTEAELEVQRSIAIHSAKLRAVGELAAGIAHQVNNPLAVLRLKLDNLMLLLQSLSLSEAERQKVRELIDGTGTHITRLAKVTTTLLRMSRNSATDGVSFLPVDHIVAEALELCRERFQANGVEVRVLASTTPQAVLVKCNATEVAQALLNLLLNAYDAVVGKPAAWIEVASLVDHGAVIVSVTDSGPGIPRDLQERIMQPFFTTKPHGAGTGVGLSIAKELVERSDAELALDTSHPNTRFIIRFPPRASRVSSLG